MILFDKFFFSKKNYLYHQKKMICNLFIKNFKSLKTVYLKLSNLNLLTGLNGSGKSSVIQALLLLRQSAVLCPKLILLFP